MAKFLRKQFEVQARRVTEDEVVETYNGPRTAHVGEWVLEGTGKAHVINDTLFRSIYDPADDEARALLEKP